MLTKSTLPNDVENVNPPTKLITMDVEAWKVEARRSLPHLTFNLTEDLAQLDVADEEGKVLRRSISKLEKEGGKDAVAAPLCRHIPVYVKHELELQADGAAQQDAAWLCMQSAFDRLQALEAKQLWQDMRSIGNSKSGQDWQGFPQLHTTFCNHISDWKFPLDAENGGTYPRNFRMPKSLYDQMCKVAGDLGIHPTQLAQVLLVDGLRSQIGTVQGEVMDRQVNNFYAKLRERIFVAVGYLKAFERAYGLVLCDDLQSVIERIEAEL